MHAAVFGVVGLALSNENFRGTFDKDSDLAIGQSDNRGFSLPARAEGNLEQIKVVSGAVGNKFFAGEATRLQIVHDATLSHVTNGSLVKLLGQWILLHADVCGRVVHDSLSNQFVVG